MQTTAPILNLQVQIINMADIIEQLARLGLKVIYAGHSPPGDNHARSDLGGTGTTEFDDVVIARPAKTVKKAPKDSTCFDADATHDDRWEKSLNRAITASRRFKWERRSQDEIAIGEVCWLLRDAVILGRKRGGLDTGKPVHIAEYFRTHDYGVPECMSRLEVMAAYGAMTGISELRSVLSPSGKRVRTTCVLDPSIRKWNLKHIAAIMFMLSLPMPGGYPTVLEQMIPKHVFEVYADCYKLWGSKSSEDDVNNPKGSDCWRKLRAAGCKHGRAYRNTAEHKRAIKLWRPYDRIDIKEATEYSFGALNVMPELAVRITQRYLQKLAVKEALAARQHVPIVPARA